MSVTSHYKLGNIVYRLSYICNSRAAANPCRFGKESKLILVTNVCVDTLGSLHK